jgi:hypothetical protein
MIDIVVPHLGESIQEATLSKWIKNIGDDVNPNLPIAELETEKITLDIFDLNELEANFLSGNLPGKSLVDVVPIVQTSMANANTGQYWGLLGLGNKCLT